MSLGNFIAECRRHGLTNTDYVIASTIRDLAGLDNNMVHKRDVLLSKTPTSKLRQKHGWMRAKMIYKFNPKGTMCFKEAKRTVKISKITRATMLVKIH